MWLETIPRARGSIRHARRETRCMDALKCRSVGCVCGLAETGDDFEVDPCGFGDNFWASLVDSGEVDQIAAHAKRACAGLKKTRSRVMSDAAGGDELEMRKWRQQRLQVTGPAHGGTGKDLHVIRAFVPRRDDFS